MAEKLATWCGGGPRPSLCWLAGPAPLARPHAHPIPIPIPLLPPLQYVVGLIVGAFQALVVLFYQWVVDPAEHGTW